MHVPDLTETSRRTLEVGWLHRDHPFRQGLAPAGFVERLKEFLHRRRACYEIFEWGVCMGFHSCGFCNEAHDTGSLGVLHEGKLYCPPTMIVHYVEQHQYLPPDEFISSVLAGPLPDTPEFAAAAASFHKKYLQSLVEKVCAGMLTQDEQREVHYFRSTGELLD